MNRERRSIHDKLWTLLFSVWKHANHETKHYKLEPICARGWSVTRIFLHTRASTTHVSMFSDSLACLSKTNFLLSYLDPHVYSCFGRSAFCWKHQGCWLRRRWEHQGCWLRRRKLIQFQTQRKLNCCVETVFFCWRGLGKGSSNVCQTRHSRQLEMFQLSQWTQSQRQSLRVLSVPLHDVLSSINLPRHEFCESWIGFTRLVNKVKEHADYQYSNFYGQAV